MEDTPAPEFSYELCFNTHTAARLAIQQYQASLGFETSVGRSKTNTQGITHRVEIKCHRAGAGTGKTTAKTGCPYKVIIRWTKARQTHFIDVGVLDHNHEPCSDAVGSSKLRLLTQRRFGAGEIRRLIEIRSRIGKNTSRDIARQLEAEHEGLMITATEVRRIKHELRQTDQSTSSTFHD